MTGDPVTDTADARRLADAATPGPWVVESSGGVDYTGEGWYHVEVGFADSVETGAGLMLGDHENADRDAEFIAAARSLVPELCDLVDRLRAENQAALALAQQISDGPPGIQGAIAREFVFALKHGSLRSDLKCEDCRVGDHYDCAFHQTSYPRCCCPERLDLGVNGARS